MKIQACLLLLCLISCGFALGAAAEFRAGAAKRIVTPDPLLPVSGGVGTPNPSTKKCGDLSVRAIVLEQGEVRVAIVGADFLGFPGILCDRVRAQVKGVKPENVIIGVTHTHSAPDMYGFTDRDGNTLADMDYIDWVCGRMAEAINEAAANLAPASLKLDVRYAEGKIAYNYYAPQLYDKRMGVMQFIAAAGANKGQPIATLVNYATHPEVIGAGQGIVSPDCIGPMYDRIEAQGGGMALFMNSAQGGMVTADCRGPNGDIQTWDECVRIGELMADEALRIVKEGRDRENPALFCAAKDVAFPVESRMMQKVLASSPLGHGQEQDVTEIVARINVVNIADAQILTIPGEALPNIGYYLKRNMAGRFNFLFGLTNEAFGYILAKVDYDSFDRYRYITTTSLGEMTGEIYMEEALALVKTCPEPKR